MKKALLFLLIGITSAGLGLVVLALCMPFVFISCEQGWARHQSLGALDEDRPRYLEIVRRIDGDLKVGESAQYLVAQDLDPVTIKRTSYDDLGFEQYRQAHRDRRLISAKRRKNGTLTVRFVTQDLGHAGTWSLVYCSGSPEWPIGDVATPVEDHWWSVENHMD